MEASILHDGRDRDRAPTGAEAKRADARAGD
jgi:hypothetical protein